MDKKLRRRLEAFQRIQARNSRYHLSQYSAHDSAIREHKTRGFAEGLTRVAGLLNQANKI